MKLMIARGSQLIIDAMPKAFDLQGSTTPVVYEVSKAPSAMQRHYQLNLKIGKMTAEQLSDAIREICGAYDDYSTTRSREG